MEAIKQMIVETLAQQLGAQQNGQNRKQQQGGGAKGNKPGDRKQQKGAQANHPGGRKHNPNGGRPQDQTDRKAANTNGAKSKVFGGSLCKLFAAYQRGLGDILNSESIAWCRFNQEWNQAPLSGGARHFDPYYVARAVLTEPNWRSLMCSFPVEHIVYADIPRLPPLATEGQHVIEVTVPQPTRPPMPGEFRAFLETSPFEAVTSTHAPPSRPKLIANMRSNKPAVNHPAQVTQPSGAAPTRAATHGAATAQQSKAAVNSGKPSAPQTAVPDLGQHQPVARQINFDSDPTIRQPPRQRPPAPTHAVQALPVKQPEVLRAPQHGPKTQPTAAFAAPRHTTATQPAAIVAASQPSATTQPARPPVVATQPAVNSVSAQPTAATQPTTAILGSPLASTTQPVALSPATQSAPTQRTAAHRTPQEPPSPAPAAPRSPATKVGVTTVASTSLSSADDEDTADEVVAMSAPAVTTNSATATPTRGSALPPLTPKRHTPSGAPLSSVKKSSHVERAGRARHDQAIALRSRSRNSLLSCIRMDNTEQRILVPRLKNLNSSTCSFGASWACCANLAKPGSRPLIVDESCNKQNDGLTKRAFSDSECRLNGVQPSQHIPQLARFMGLENLVMVSPCACTDVSDHRIFMLDVVPAVGGGRARIDHIDSLNVRGPCPRCGVQQTLYLRDGVNEDQACCVVLHSATGFLNVQGQNAPPEHFVMGQYRMSVMATILHFGADSVNGGHFTSVLNVKSYTGQHYGLVYVDDSTTSLYRHDTADMDNACYIFAKVEGIIADDDQADDATAVALADIAEQLPARGF
jgi:hypothetical protein